MKYKEFWIDFKFGEKESTHQITDVSLIKLRYPYKNIFHLIEHQALLDEAEAHKKTAAALQKEIEKLQKQNEKLKTALEVYAMADDSFPEYKNVAVSVLKELDNDPAS